MCEILQNFNKTVKHLMASLGHNCLITEEGTAYCWGSNEFNQVSADENVTYLPQPTVLPLSKRARDLVLGPTYSCFILEDNTAECHGFMADDFRHVSQFEGPVNHWPTPTKRINFFTAFKRRVEEFFNARSSDGLPTEKESFDSSSGVKNIHYFSTKDLVNLHFKGRDRNTQILSLILGAKLQKKPSSYSLGDGFYCSTDMGKLVCAGEIPFTRSPHPINKLENFGSDPKVNPTRWFKVEASDTSDFPMGFEIPISDSNFKFAVGPARVCYSQGESILCKGIRPTHEFLYKHRPIEKNHLGMDCSCNECRVLRGLSSSQVRYPSYEYGREPSDFSREPERIAILGGSNFLSKSQLIHSKTPAPSPEFIQLPEDRDQIATSNTINALSGQNTQNPKQGAQTPINLNDNLGFSNLGNTCFANTLYKLFFIDPSIRDVFSPNYLIQDERCSGTELKSAKISLQTRLRDLFQIIDDSFSQPNTSPSGKDAFYNAALTNIFLEVKNICKIKNKNPDDETIPSNRLLVMRDQMDPDEYLSFLDNVFSFENSDFGFNTIYQTWRSSSDLEFSWTDPLHAHILRIPLPEQKENVSFSLTDLLTETVFTKEHVGSIQQKLHLVAQSEHHLPKSVWMQLLRYSNSGIIQKNMSAVDLPKEITLDFLDGKSNPNENPEVLHKQYFLAGIAVHEGTSLQSGHYVSYIKHAQPGVSNGDLAWYRHSDREVIQVGPTLSGSYLNNPDNGIRHNSYIILYKEIDP